MGVKKLAGSKPLATTSPVPMGHNPLLKVLSKPWFILKSSQHQDGGIQRKPERRLGN